MLNIYTKFITRHENEDSGGGYGVSNGYVGPRQRHGRRYRRFFVIKNNVR